MKKAKISQETGFRAFQNGATGGDKHDRGKEEKEEREGNDDSDQEPDPYESLSLKELKELCKNACETVSGSKDDLITRLRFNYVKPCMKSRIQHSYYVPDKQRSNNTNILVSLLLHDHGAGITKDDLFNICDESGISENAFSGGTTQTGPFIYNGLAGLKKLTGGEVPLNYSTIECQNG